MILKLKKKWLITCVCFVFVSLVLSTGLQAQPSEVPISQTPKQGLSGSSQDVRQELLEAILTDPKISSSNSDKRLTQADTQQIQAMIQELAQVIQKDPNNGVAYYKLGRLYSIKGDNETAIGKFKKAIKLSQKDDLAYYGAGISYYRLNNMSEAKAYIREAFNLDLKGWLSWLSSQRRDPKPEVEAEKYNTGFRDYRGDRKKGTAAILSARNYFCKTNSSANINRENSCEKVQNCMCSLGIKAGESVPSCPQKSAPTCEEIKL